MTHRWPKARTASALALGALLVLNCHESSAPGAPANVAVSIDAAQVELGDTALLTVTITDAKGRAIAAGSSGTAVTYSSSDNSVAHVSATGHVTTFKTGSASLTATAGSASGHVDVSVIATVQSVALTLNATLDVGDSTPSSPTATSLRGFGVTGRPVTYGTTNAAVATVSAAGFVRGVAPGSASITATIDGKTGSAPVTVQPRPASLHIDQVSPRIPVGGSLQLTASVLDSSDNVVNGRTITWSAASAQRVVVASNGMATWQAPGSTVVTARSGSVSNTVVVATGGDFAITKVALTQGVQDAGGSVPLISNGQPAAVLVLIATQTTVTQPMDVRLTLYNGDNSVAYTATTSVTDPINATASLALPTAKFLLPAAQIKQGRAWQVTRDPTGQAPDDSIANDVYPRGAPAQLVVADVPPLNVRFVPITLLSNGNATPTITDADIPGYLQTLQSTLPIGQITTSIGAAYSTSTTFGAPPTGGAITFWSALLSELNAARLASGDDANTYWYGVVSPPPGFTFTLFGGISFVPPDPLSTGSGTHTSLGVRTGWFSAPTQARDLVAHELSHSFGRSHSPCGGPAGIDPNYPRSDGTIGELMHNVFFWSGNPGASLGTIPASSGDIMGYCFPGWASVYTYKGVLNARGPAFFAGGGGVAGGPTDVIAIQGDVWLDGRAAPTLLPSLVFRGRASRPDAAGNHRLQGFDADGRSLFDYTFAPTPVADAPGLGPFTFTLPLDATTQRLARVRVTGPSGTAELNDAALGSTGAPRARLANGRVAAECGDAAARVAIQDDATGQLLGIANGGSLSVVSAAARITVSCARGAQPSRRAFTLR